MLRATARRAKRLLELLSLSGDLRTFRVLKGLLVDGKRFDGRTTVRLRPLGNAELTIRGNASDAPVVRDTFIGRYHRPLEIVEQPRLIVDLGANIGTTAADFAHRFPSARIVAAELDAETAELCRENTRTWADRITVVQAAVWSEGGGEISYSVETGEEWGAAVSDDGSLTAPTMTVDELLAGHSGPVDYLKMDIEGAEREVLAAGGDWVARTRVLQVELHGYDVAQCIDGLRAMGFEARPDERHWSAVVARRAL